MKIKTPIFFKAIKLVKGFEPPTYGLQIRCSTVELHQQLDF
jgi:hypothetical protein